METVVNKTMEYWKLAKGTDFRCSHPTQKRTV